MLRSLKDSVSSKVTLLPKPVRLSNESQIPRVIAKFPLIRVFQALLLVLQAAGVTVTSLGQVATPHSPAHPRAILATPHSPSQATLATPHSPHGSLCHGSLTLHAQWIRITAFPPWSTWSFPVQRNDKLQIMLITYRFPEPQGRGRAHVAHSESLPPPRQYLLQCSQHKTQTYPAMCSWVQDISDELC